MHAHARIAFISACTVLAAAATTSLAQPLFATHQILDPNPAAGNEFGKTTAIGDGILAIGAPGDDAHGQNAGAIHLYSRHGQSWLHDTTLYQIAGSADDAFGSVMSLEGNLLIAGAPSSDIYGTDSGVAIVYRRINGAWTFDSILTAPSPERNEGFGSTVAINGDLALVDSPRALYVFKNVEGTWTCEQTIAGTGGFGSHLSIDPAGSAFAIRPNSPDIFIYRRSPNTAAWVFAAFIRPSQPGASHSARFSLDGDRLAARVFVQGIGSHVAVYRNGAGNDWSKTAELRFGSSQAPNFGSTIKLRGNLLVAGDSQAVTADYFNGPASAARLIGSTWTQTAQLRSTDWTSTDNAHITDFFGNTAVVGAYTDDVNGIASGSAYLYDITCVGDFDNTGFVDTDDYDAFVQAFIDADPAADVDNSGFVDTEDFTFFVNQFELGC
jgi:hypothetical protein